MMPSGDKLGMLADAATPAFIEVTIKYHVASGQVVQITGPMGNGLMMYGILGLARECLDLWRAKNLRRDTQAISLPPSGVLTPNPNES